MRKYCQTHRFFYSVQGVCRMCEADSAKPKCPTCSLTDPKMHPCDEHGTLTPCADAFHETNLVVTPKVKWELSPGDKKFLRGLRISED